MANIQGRKRSVLSPKARAWVAIVVLAGLSFILGRATWGIYQKNHLARINRQATERELNDLKARQASVEAKLSGLKTVAGVEEEIRRVLPVAKEGERVIIIVDDTATDTLDQGPGDKVKKVGFWATIFKSF